MGIGVGVEVGVGEGVGAGVVVGVGVGVGPVDPEMRSGSICLMVCSETANPNPSTGIAPAISRITNVLIPKI